MTEEEIFEVLREVTGGKPWVLLTVEVVAGSRMGVGLMAGGGLDAAATERVVALSLDAIRREL